MRIIAKPTTNELESGSRYRMPAGMLGVLIIWAFAGAAGAGPLVLHPAGEPLSSQFQGPFVTTADGGVLCIDSTQAHRSLDEGKTWSSSSLFKDAGRFSVSDERALLRTKEGTIISSWMNSKESAFPKGPRGWIWDGTPEDFKKWILPTYIMRSLDDGKTWEEPILLQRPWCGCIHSMIQLSSGRIVLVGQTIIPEWRHATVMYVSDDQGKTWQTSNVLDYGIGKHDHAGSCEATVLELKDGSLSLLLRTESGYFFEAESADGLNWVNLKKSTVRSVTCCGNIYRLSDGRAALLWNHPLRQSPEDIHRREELSIAFSNDDGQSWGDRTVIATRYRRSGDGFATTRVSYPYLYERTPGEFWITTMQGGLRMKLRSSDIATGEAPLPESVVLLGDSTTAYRPGAVKLVASDLIDRALVKTESPLLVLNQGVPGDTTTGGLARLQAGIELSRPRVLVIQFGINDAAIDQWKSPPSTTSRVSLKDFESNLRKMIELGRAHGATVILATTNPVRWTPKLKELYGKPPYEVAAEDGFDRPVLSAYQQKVLQLAKELDLSAVDIHQAYLDEAKSRQVSVDEFLLDGLHPNDAGHEIGARALLPVILKSLENGN